MVARFSISVSEELLHEIDAIAAACGCTRTRAASQLLAQSVAHRYQRGEYMRRVIDYSNLLEEDGYYKDEDSRRRASKARSAELLDVRHRLAAENASEEEIQLARVAVMRRQVEDLRSLCMERGLLLDDE